MWRPHVRGIAVGNTPVSPNHRRFAFTLLRPPHARVEGRTFVRAGSLADLAHPAAGQDIHGATLGCRLGASRGNARRARGLYAVLYYDLARSRARAELSAEFCPLEELLRRSDSVSLHVNSPRKRGLIGRAELAR